MSYKTHVVFEVDSDERTVSSAHSGDFTLQLTNPIKMSSKSQYYMRLEDVRIPTSFYNITELNNVLVVQEYNGVDTDIITYTAEPGNYLITELLDEIETYLDANTVQANDYTVSRSDITGKVSFSFTGGSTQMTVDYSASSMSKVLGITADLVAADSVVVSGQNHVNLNPVRHLHILTDIGARNQLNTTQYTNASIKVPITVGRSSIQVYENHDGYFTRVENQHNIAAIRLTVLDADKNVVNFNGIDWSANLVIYKYRGATI